MLALTCCVSLYVHMCGSNQVYLHIIIYTTLIMKNLLTMVMIDVHIIDDYMASQSSPQL